MDVARRHYEILHPRRVGFRSNVCVVPVDRFPTDVPRLHHRQTGLDGRPFDEVGYLVQRRLRGLHRK